MPSKYDTNPLDPDFPERAKAEAERATAVLDAPSRAETRQFALDIATAPTEQETRRFENFQYQQAYDGQYVPVNFRPTALAEDDTGRRKVEKFGIRENIAIALPYFPWYLGLVAGIVMLILLPRSETKVRFHAAQGLAAHVGILIVTAALGIIDNVTNVADVANAIFQVVTTIMLLVFAYKAWKGRPVHIESIETLTNWLEDKIDPKLVNH